MRFTTFLEDFLHNTTKTRRPTSSPTNRPHLTPMYAQGVWLGMTLYNATTGRWTMLIKTDWSLLTAFACWRRQLAYMKGMRVTKVPRTLSRASRPHRPHQACEHVRARASKAPCRRMHQDRAALTTLSRLRT